MSAKVAPTYSRKKPYLAAITDRWLLTKQGSAKETHHVVIDLADSGLTYQPGDSLGVFAHNPPALVDELLELLPFSPDTPLEDGATLRQQLIETRTLNRAGKKFLKALPDFLPDGEKKEALTQLGEDAKAASSYLFDRDYVDILREYPEAKIPSPETFLSLLTPITPRLYSIASSLDAHPGEVHLCIGIVRYESHGRDKKGLCSGFFADHVEPNTPSVPVYVQATHNFKLPEDGSKDIIMIGPGTGIAPFRAFLEQRVKEGGSGRNWLFFGEQHKLTDFFYEDEWIAFQKAGHLNRLDVAFSRDQAEKIYVQDRMKENAAELWNWISNGAYFYVCGDAKRMAKDVHQELIRMAQTEGGLSEEAATAYVNDTLIRTERRYRRDIY